MANDTITAVEGLRVGHAEDNEARTGCTAILFDQESDVACEARGGWPGTYDTHSIEVTKTFVKKHAIFLTGGDVFGFDCALGIRRYLLEKSLASSTGVGKLPGIVGANIYDLSFASIQNAKYPDLGYAACKNASTQAVIEGNVGAGTGATVGKLIGIEHATKGGCGTTAVALPGGIVVGALVITNALGNVFENGKIIAGTRGEKRGQFLAFEDLIGEYLEQAAKQNTTIGIVATNANLTHEQLIKVAQMAHNGFAMAIRPVHTSRDGDTIFAVSTAKLEVRGRERLVDVIGYMGSSCVADSIVRSVRAARTLSNVPSCNDFSR